MNKVFLVGRLVSDPEPFTTRNGINQSRITIATQDNRSRNESYFFPCVAWQNAANFINTYLHKGDLVAIDGKLTRRSFVSKEGKTVYITEIVIDMINSIGSKRDNANATNKIPTKSIDQSFPEQVVQQDTSETKSNNNTQQNNNQSSTNDVEWFDEVNKK
ncbi:MAG: single-stranded DNA-binding protein [Mycoplasmataceae bacterium]|nr:single-stranded DNA-binding protein [Mycoplasmataceae bacterium]